MKTTKRRSSGPSAANSADSDATASVATWTSAMRPGSSSCAASTAERTSADLPMPARAPQQHVVRRMAARQAQHVLGRGGLLLVDPAQQLEPRRLDPRHGARRGVIPHVGRSGLPVRLGLSCDAWPIAPAR